jgi:hypothetical protein
MRLLQVSHATHCWAGLPAITALPGKTACKNQRARHHINLTQTRDFVATRTKFFGAAVMGLLRLFVLILDSVSFGEHALMQYAGD